MGAHPKHHKSHDPEEDREYDTDEEQHYDIMEFESGEALDTVDEAWKHFKRTGELHLHQVCLDRRAIAHLMTKLAKLKGPMDSDQKARYRTDKVRNIEMEACSFLDNEATRLWLKFLQTLGDELEEIFIIGIPNEFHNGDRCFSIVRGMQFIPSMERFAVDRADLRGRNVGLILQNFLAQCPHIKELRLGGCRIDNHMFLPFMHGLKNHCGLRRLDLDGWELNDVEFAMLVETLVNSPSRHTLKCLDISNSSIGPNSFPSLARLLKTMDTLEELILCSCKNLFDNDAGVNVPGFRDFVGALRTSKCLRELWLNGCHIMQPLASPMLEALQDNATLEVLRVEGMVVQSYKESMSTWRWLSGKGPKQKLVETTVPLAL
mmetsp:Transcript_21843/g.60724  ORF Transcript_21843/g.60724 Transcript_21843/m.60724 type:complete len:376 (-) Transcript_21843:543-1670(-)